MSKSKYGLVVHFYELDLSHASAIKQSLVDKVLPDAAKVSYFTALYAQVHFVRYSPKPHCMLHL